MIAALYRPAHGNHGPGGGHAPGKGAERLGVDAGIRRRPVGILRHPVGLARQVGVEAVEPHTIFFQKTGIVEPFVDQGMGKTEHDRGVGVGPRRQPFGPELVDEIVADRADLNELDPGPARVAQIVLGLVPAEAVLRHLAVFR